MAFKLRHTGSLKKHENWKTTWGLLTDILQRMKGQSIKLNMRNISAGCLSKFIKLFNRGVACLQCDSINMRLR